ARAGDAGLADRPDAVGRGRQIRCSLDVREPARPAAGMGDAPDHTRARRRERRLHPVDVAGAVDEPHVFPAEREPHDPSKGLRDAYGVRYTVRMPAVKRTRTTDDGKLTRARLVETGLALLAEHGADGLSMRA